MARLVLRDGFKLVKSLNFARGADEFEAYPYTPQGHINCLFSLPDMLILIGIILPLEILKDARLMVWKLPYIQLRRVVYSQLKFIVYFPCSISTLSPLAVHVLLPSLAIFTVLLPPSKRTVAVLPNGTSSFNFTVPSLRSKITPITPYILIPYYKRLDIFLRKKKNILILKVKIKKNLITEKYYINYLFPIYIEVIYLVKKKKNLFSIL